MDFDGQVVRQDDQVADLAKNFVCVRIQSMNGVNLNQFQFEYDLTWMSFFQDAKGRTYARYGGREDHDAESHLNRQSLLRVMRQVLDLHKEGKVQPAGRYEPVAASVSTPEDIPTMKKMLARRKEKCIHCHDVKAATLRHRRELGALRKEMVFTYPSPSNLGIHLDSERQNVVKRVDPESPAAGSGIRSGDTLLSADGQRVLTFADLTRVLELAPKTGTLPLAVRRDGKTVETKLRLPEGWRKRGDPGWRASTGVVGPSSGFWGARANAQQRKQLGLGEADLGVRVTYIWGKWTRAAGIRNGDYVVEIAGQKTDMTIRQLQAHLQLNKDWGDEIPIVVVRSGKRVNLTMKLPATPPN